MPRQTRTLTKGTGETKHKKDWKARRKMQRQTRSKIRPRKTRTRNKGNDENNAKSEE